MRTFWRGNLSASSSEPEDKWNRVEVPQDEANLVGSRGTDGMHYPALDLDYPARLVPSSTEGHFHLYLDAPLTWEQYEKLLDVMAEVGLLEPGYVRASKKRRQTFLRKPGTVREEPRK